MSRPLFQQDRTLTPGEKLRRQRNEMNLTLRDVHAKTRIVAGYFDNDEFAISIARLSEIETKGVVPNIYRLSALSIVYDVPLPTILSWYGVQVDDVSVRRYINQQKALAAKAT